MLYGAYSGEAIKRELGTLVNDLSFPKKKNQNSDFSYTPGPQWHFGITNVKPYDAITEQHMSDLFINLESGLSIVKSSPSFCWQEPLSCRAERRFWRVPNSPATPPRHNSNPRNRKPSSNRRRNKPRTVPCRMHRRLRHRSQRSSSSQQPRHLDPLAPRRLL